MALAEAAFVDRQRTLEELFGIGVLALIAVHLCQVEACGHIGVAPAQGLFFDIQRAFQQPLGIGVLSLQTIQRRQAVQSLRNIGLTRRLFPDCQCAFVEALSITVLGLGSVYVAQIVKERGDVELVYSWCGLLNCECALVECLRLVPPALCFVDDPQHIKCGSVILTIRPKPRLDGGLVFLRFGECRGIIARRINSPKRLWIAERSPPLDAGEGEPATAGFGLVAPPAGVCADTGHAASTRNATMPIPVQYRHDVMIRLLYRNCCGAVT